uniref:Uncharacterized protein MANES_02G150800 n=1 Tax=Rhizophora mucronata TaxID=61149 RepID=A0A2P2N2W3_RHIMU
MRLALMLQFRRAPLWYFSTRGCS